MPRDPRFVAVHRGGLLPKELHRMLAFWAADCAEHVLRLFEERYPEDDRPRHAIATARAWARGEAAVGAAQKAAAAAHAAARAVRDTGAREAARAAGHAAATAHMADHSLGAAAYAVRAVQGSFGESTGGALEAEREFQRSVLPEEIRALVQLGQTKMPPGWK